MFDAYGNHVMVDSEVQLNLKGFQILDQIGLKRKVCVIISFLVRLCYYEVILKARFRDLLKIYLFVCFISIFIISLYISK